MISFHIRGEPVAFARSRHNGKQHFTAKPQRDFMMVVGLQATQAMAGQQPLECAVELQVRAVYPIPKSWRAKRAAEARWRTSKPDVDNIAKLVADSLNKIVYLDDAQVAQLTVQKVYGPLPGVTVSVQPLEGDFDEPCREPASSRHGLARSSRVGAPRTLGPSRRAGERHRRGDDHSFSCAPSPGHRSFRKASAGAARARGARTTWR